MLIEIVSYPNHPKEGKPQPFNISIISMWPTDRALSNEERKTHHQPRMRYYCCRAPLPQTRSHVCESMEILYPFSCLFSLRLISPNNMVAGWLGEEVSVCGVLVSCRELGFIMCNKITFYFHHGRINA